MEKKIRSEIAEKLGWDKAKVDEIEKILKDAPVVDVSDDYIAGFNAGAEMMSNRFMAHFKKLQDAMMDVAFELHDMAKNPARLEK